MTPAQWSRVEALFQQCADLPNAEREQVLERLRSEDAHVHAEVTALLKHDRNDDTNVRQMLESAADALFRAQDRSFIGQLVGRWRLLRHVGTGGMGRVYVAERADRHFTQHVAVKLLGVGTTTPATRSRFQRECQMLAELSHPNIGRLFDGGMTDDGVPYLVMEYIDGVPIDRFVADHALGLRERLRLFVSVCSAVQAAHQRLIVHCDIKPSNILVTPDGVPKLLDFGIGTMLGRADDDPESPPGARKLRMMTPEHASPEQAAGEPVTTATDVYALGILLYMLLTRKSPYRLDPGGSHAEIVRAICESVTEPPSSSIAGEPWPGDQVGSDQRSSRRLRRRLQGDIDAIVLKALQKNPADRYGSARELAADIENHLAHRPVSARGGSVSYRAAKYVRRHAIGVALGSVILGVSIGFAVTSTVQAQRIDRERLLAERVADFLVGLFSAADPHVQPEQVTARHLLDEGTQSLESELASEPQLQTRLQTTIGRAYRNLGLYSQAQTAFERAITRQATTLGPSDPSIADLYYELGLLKQAAGDYPGARDAHVRSYEMNVKTRGEDDVSSARSLSGVAVMHWQFSEYEEATSKFERALPVLTANLGNDHGDVIAARHNLALVLEKVGNYDRALEIETEVLAALRRKHGDVHPKVATVLNLMAALEDARGNHRAALEMFREALRIDEQVLGREHPFVAFDLEALGGQLATMGEYTEAGQVLERAVAIREANDQGETSDMAYALRGLAGLRIEQGELQAAEGQLLRALTIEEKQVGSAHENYADILTTLGALYSRQGNHRRAIETQERALGIMRAALGENHAIYGETMMDVASARAAAGEVGAAEKLGRSGMEIVERAYGPGNLRTHAARAAYAGILSRDAASAARASALLREEIAFLEKEFGAAHPDVAELCAALARVDVAAGAKPPCRPGSPTAAR